MPKKPEPTKPTEPIKIDGIRVLPGDTSVVIVAPHGPFQMKKRKPHYRNDERTGLIAKAIHDEMGWFTVINDAYIKPNTEPKVNTPNFETKRLDLFKTDQAKLVPGYLDAIKAAVDDNAGKTLVVWLHGMMNSSATKAQKAFPKSADGELHALIGFGQGAHPRVSKLRGLRQAKNKDERSQYSARKKTVVKFLAELTKRGLTTLVAENDSKNFRGRDPNRLNQWFREQRVPLDKVESIQIEIREKGFRKNQKQCEKTALILVQALNTLLPEPVAEELPVSAEAQAQEMVESIDALASKAFSHLKDLFRRHFHEAMLEAGRYIINEFYGGDFQRAREKNPEHDTSLRQLIVMLQENSGDAPSKTWVYDAVNLAVDTHLLEGFRTYGKIGHSHKVLLTHVPEMKRKKLLVKETAKENYTVVRLRERIKETGPPKQPILSADNVPPDGELEKYKPKKLEKLRDDLGQRITTYGENLKKYKADKTRVEKVIKAIPKGKKKARKVGFRDWTDPSCNVNMQTGCSNACLYCYAKMLAVRRGQLDVDSWAIPLIRQHDLDNPRKLYPGLVGFPSTHDITPDNVEAYLLVLGKLLRQGNEVLIVSKPRLECINSICDASYFFKDKILFRFTIGAMSNKLLGFWEPNAPTYADRKKALKYAFEQGFRTSVSIEPMLDSANVEKLVADLMPFITKDVWIGKMNHLGQFRDTLDAEMKMHLEMIEKGQTAVRIAELHKAFTDNPKVKWKTGTLPTKPPRTRKPKFKGWPNVQIKNDAGEETAAVAPLIVSASRRNDIPAHYADWFMERLRRGHLAVKYPKRKYISFNNTKFIIFWTKNPAPMLPYLDELDKMGIQYYFQFTLNNYGKEGLEPNVPALAERIETLKTLSERIGKEKVIWRFDPLVLTDVITRDFLVKKVETVCRQVRKHTEKLVISFLAASKHKKVVRNLKKAEINYQDFKQADVAFMAQHLGDMGKKYGIQIMTCSEVADLSFYGIGKSKCIDDGLLRRISNDDQALMDFIGNGGGLKDAGQRKQCGCIPSVDVGTMNTCQHLCHYCYSNVSEKAVKANLERITGDGEFLVD